MGGWTNIISIARFMFPPPVLRGRVREEVRANDDRSTQPPRQPSPGVPREGVKSVRVAMLVVWLALLAAFGSAVAAAPPVAQTAKPPSVESEPIRHAATSDSPQTADAPDTDHSGNFELPRVAGALAVVLALIFILRWGGLRIFNSPATQKASRSVQVLSRSVLAPRQHILLVQVGKRVLVVGDSGGQ